MAFCGRVLHRLLASAALTCLAATAFADELAAGEADHVVTLTTDNFDAALKEHERVLVEFYAPWCGHCKSLEPEYRRAAAEMKQDNLRTVLAKVDATVEKDLAERYGVSGFPTLKYFVTGDEPREYNGDRTAAGIKAWLKKRELPAVVTLGADEAAAYTASTESFFKNGGELPKGMPAGGFRLVAKVVKKSARAKAYFAAVQSHLVDWEVVSITPQVLYLPKSADPKGPETSLTLWRPDFEDDAKVVEFQGKWTESAIAKWVKSSTYPTVGKLFNHKLYSDAMAEEMGKDGVVAVVLDDGGEDDETQEHDKLRPQVMKELLPLARAEPRWFFTAVSMDSLTPADQEILGISARSLSTVVILKGKSRYHLHDKGDSAVTRQGAVKDLLESVKAGKAKRFYKSAAVPQPEMDEDGVTTLVGDTFEKYVLDPKKDVFVEFYAPWCGHCKKLAPVWADIARKSKAEGWADKGLVIAKMDATENESQEEIKGYPKLVLYPAVKPEKTFKQKLDYSGARDFEPLVDFILSSARTLEGIELTGTKQKKYSMVDRELARKKGGSAAHAGEL